MYIDQIKPLNHYITPTHEQIVNDVCVVINLSVGCSLVAHTRG